MSRRARFRIWSGIAVLACLSPRSDAQAPPLAGEFRVNTYTTGNQAAYGAAMDRLGNFVVTWTGSGAGDAVGCFGDRFDEAGARRGGEFQVNQDTTGYQVYPALASDAVGNFVVVWTSQAQDGAGFGVFARRYDRTGAALGGEFRVNTHTPLDQAVRSVAVDGGGNFVVVWQSQGQDGSGAGIFGQRYDNSGAAQGSEFPVNVFTTGDQTAGAVAMDGSGSFVVVWNGQGATSTHGIFGRRYDASGIAQGGEFEVDAPTGSADYPPSIAMDRGGDFLVVWSSEDPARGILGRRFDPTGTPLGSAFRVDSYTSGTESTPAVAMDPDGNAFVAWQSADQDGSGLGIFAQRFERGGQAVGPEFPVNAYTTGDQEAPRVATTSRGQFVVAWSSTGQEPDTSVFARRGTLAAADAIAVDGRSAVGTSSNANGVLEPGERVFVETGWKNTGSSAATFTGTATELTGPAGATYTLDDSAAAYGTVPAGSAADCFSATGNCYQVTVSNPALRPVSHWDVALQENLSLATPKTWTLHVGESFADVPVSQPFYRKIETLFHNAITTGCTATTYCPGDVVSRSQMALFIGRGIAGGGAAIPSKGSASGKAYDCSAGGKTTFADVAPTDIFCKSVEYIAAQNVTLGCDAARYCPGDVVTRLQMAGFVAKAVVAPGGGAAIPTTYGPDPTTGLSYSCNPASPAIHFNDVPATDPFCKHAHYLWARGIIQGCSDSTYCPADAVTRDTMAKFLSNAFALQLYGP